MTLLHTITLLTILWLSTTLSFLWRRYHKLTTELTLAISDLNQSILLHLEFLYSPLSPEERTRVCLALRWRHPLSQELFPSLSQMVTEIPDNPFFNQRFPFPISKERPLPGGHSTWKELYETLERQSQHPRPTLAKERSLRSVGKVVRGNFGASTDGTDGVE